YLEAFQYDRCDQSRVDVRRSCCTRVVGLICQMFSSKKSSQHFHSRILDDARRYLIMNAAPKWRQLEIVPVTILFNLYEFIRVLTNFSEYYEKNTEDRPLEGIRSFIFKWQLHLHERGNQNAKMIGTGGEMLKSLSLLLSHLHGLNELELRELQLEPWECNHFVDDLLYQFDSQLTSLCLINLTKVPRPFLQIGLFLYLEHLTVSPQHLDESVVILVADLRQLKSFIIYQNEKALGASAVSAKAWQAFSASNKHTRVYLIQVNHTVIYSFNQTPLFTQLSLKIQLVN
uniref:F-box domain-containing protein n=1 Tax=Parascaris univalens TaxID=6257 RepID=A0A915AHD3_PARUN